MKEIKIYITAFGPFLNLKKNLKKYKTNRRIKPSKMEMGKRFQRLFHIDE